MTISARFNCDEDCIGGGESPRDGLGVPEATQLERSSLPAVSKRLAVMRSLELSYGYPFLLIWVLHTSSQDGHCELDH